MGTGCSTTRTRVEQLPAVLICRDRCKFLEEALHQSYALADAHLAYMRSLRSVGPALRRFFEIFPPAAATNNCPTSPATDSTSHSHKQFDDHFGTNTDDDRHSQEFYPMHGSCEVVTSTIPATPPAASSWDYYFINLFDVDQYSVAAMKGKQQEDETKSEDEENGAIMSCSNREKGESEQRSNWTKELEDLFQKASDSGVRVLKMLDTQKFRYHYHPTSGYWKMLEGSQDDDEWLISTDNLSSTLRKLCMWEHKLLGEVRVEEKLCMLLHIKKLKEKGGHDDSSGSYSIRALSSEVKVAFHVIQNIFCTINSLTEEELWPHINQLIHRLSGMWQLMSEIHQKQRQIVKVFCDGTEEANNFGVKELEILDDDHHLQVAAAGVVLEQELQSWCLNFAKWIKAQRACINALNAWLHLNYDHDHKPGEGREHHQASTTITCMPLVFLIIGEWSNAMDRVSEEQVVAALNTFSATIVGLQLADHQIMKHTAAHDGREGQKVQIKMKTALASTPQVGQALTYKAEKHGASYNASPLSCLEQVFMAMEKLATDWKQAYQAIIAGHALEKYV